METGRDILTPSETSSQVKLWTMMYPKSLFIEVLLSPIAGKHQV